MPSARQREDAVRSPGRLVRPDYGTLIKELRIESRAIFVLDPENKIRHAEYVKEVADHPNYEAALSAARNAGAAVA